VCDDKNPNWHSLREKHLTAGVASRTLKKNIFGSGGYGSIGQLLRWYNDSEYREKEQKKLDENPYCRHGLFYQAEGAALYSLVTGFTVTPLGFIKGPVEGEGFADVPDYLAATCDYLCVQEPIIVEIKCPAKIHKNWRERYWVQCQHQMQIARVKTLHLVMYIPPSQHEKGLLQIEVIHCDNAWFKRALPSYERFWKMVCMNKKV